MIDPLISLSFSMQSNKGVYALLLGSGVSRSAEIPTGWDIVKDIIRKLAYAQKENCEPDPISWYKSKYKDDPDYSKLLEGFKISPTERNQLLKPYFEPTPKELAEGKKIPTLAHKAITKLVREGYIRVIITTNFDRLIETALQEEGISPIVISSPEAAEGAIPLSHSRCTVLKPNGDYLDVRFKNLTGELSVYDSRIDRLLDQIYDEYGLIICGWSADWDIALRKALQRCKTRRFTTFWCIKDNLIEKAEQLVTFRQAQTIIIKDADTFFNELYEKVSAIEKYEQPHPLSAKLAIATIEKYIVNESDVIQVQNLVYSEVEKVYEKLISEKVLVQGSPEIPAIQSAVKEIESLVEIVQALIITGMYWGKSIHEYIWIRALERLTDQRLGKKQPAGINAKLIYYPALLLFYSGSIAAIAKDNYDILNAIFNKAKGKFSDVEECVLAVKMKPDLVIEDVLAGIIFNKKEHFTPFSNYLFDILKQPISFIIPDDNYYKKCFDRFEYLLGLSIYFSTAKKNGFIGSYGWRNRTTLEKSIMNITTKEINEQENNWLPFKAQLFGSNFNDFKNIKAAFDKEVIKIINGWR